MILFLLLIVFGNCEKYDNSYVPESIIDSTGLMGMLDSPWPCEGHDSRRSSQSRYNGPDDSIVVWTYNASPGFHAEEALSPVIDDEGNLYSIVWTSLLKLDASGNDLWFEGLGYYLWSMPTLSSDGKVLVTGYSYSTSTGWTDGGCYALDKSGNELWKFETEDQYDGGVSGAATVAPDGTIYLADGGGYLYAVSPNGGIRWKYATNRRTASSPALTAEGTIITIDYDNYIYAILPDGSLKWQKQIDANVGYDMAVDINGTIYLITENGLISMSSEGDILWDFAVSGGVSYRPAVGKDHTIVFGGRDGFVYALNPDGTEKWKFETGDALASTPTLDARGHVYIGGCDNFLYSFTDQGVLKWKYSLRIAAGQPTIGADGTLYVGTKQGLVVAFKD
jgi:outer membrane protein assembly factor BamB